jgi:hypothetical protein
VETKDLNHSADVRIRRGLFLPAAVSTAALCFLSTVAMLVLASNDIFKGQFQQISEPQKCPLLTGKISDKVIIIPM